MAFSYGDYNDELDHTLKAEEENTDSLFLFANNNAGTAENLGNYRLYDMKIEGDSEGVESGINYYDYITYYKGSVFDTNIPYRSGTTVEFKIGKNHETSGDCIIVQTRNGSVGYRDNGETIRSNLEANDNGENITLKSNTNVYSYTFTKSETDFYKPYFCVGSSNSNTVNNDSFCSIEYWKFYYNNSLIGYFRPCVDRDGVQCLYDDVTQRYYYSSQLSTFSCKSHLRDFQPVLDKNNVPCLMDKINRKYYYDKNGNTFNCKEQVGYRAVSYLQGNYNSYIDTGLRANEMHGYTIEIQYKRVTDYSRGNQLVFGSSRGGFDSSEVNCHLRYNYYGYPQGLSYSDEVNNALYNPNVDTIINATFAINTPSSTSSFYLFAGNNNDSPIGTCDATIYYWKIYDTNSNLVQHLVPALDSNNVPCMYDKVSQQFFYNQGTGEFSYGIEELECPPVDYVEYIEGGTNGQYIDTVVKFCTGYTYKMKLKIDNVKSTIMFGLSSFDRPNFGYELGFGLNPETTRVYFGNYVNYLAGVKDSLLNGYDITFSPTQIILGDKVTKITVSNKTSTLAPQLFNNIYNGGNIKTKFYYWKVYDENNELIQDLRPCLDEDKVVCMYDTISREYFYNKGYGEFSSGERLDYTPISYIESDGTQYIDTEVVANDNTDIDMVCRACNSNVFALDYYYNSASTHYYAPKFACSELNNTLINNSTHSITVDYYDENGSWKWQSELGSGSTTDISMHSYISIRFVGENVVNYINDYTFILGNELSSNSRDSDIRIILQDYTVYGNIMNNLTINKLYKYQDTNTTIEPNLTASEGATLTLGTTNLGYLSEEEIEQATNDGWTLE